MSDVISKQIKNNVTIDLDGRVVVNKNYLRLDNKPSINGVCLEGDKSLSELNLLSNKESEYTQVELNTVDKTDCLLVLGRDGVNKKIEINKISSRTMQTAKELPNTLEVGSYVFLLKEDKK